MPTMWDRLRPAQQKDHSAPALNRKKLEEWQNSRGPSQGYSYTIKGGARPERPPRNFQKPKDNHNNTKPYLLCGVANNALEVRTQDADTTLSQQSNRSACGPGPTASRWQLPVSQLRLLAIRPSSFFSVFAAVTRCCYVRCAAAPRQNLQQPKRHFPPSSPDVSTLRNGPHAHQDGDVSPIQEVSQSSHFNMDHGTTGRSGQARSNIPMMRREQRQKKDAALSALRESKSREQLRQPRPHGHDVRWDALTGEPTTSEKGRPSFVDPHQEVQKYSGPSSLPINHPTANPSPFGERIRRTQPPRQASSSPQTEPPPRPEWRGASGHPPKSSKRPPRGAGVLSPVDSLGSETSSSSPPIQSKERLGSRALSGATRSAVPSSTPWAPAPADPKPSTSNVQAYPSPPLSDDTSVPAKVLPKPVTQVHPAPEAQSPPSSLFPPNEKAIRRKPAAQGHQPPSATSSVYSQLDIHPAQAPPGGFPVDEWTQPPSRFSVTTYATSAHSANPRHSADLNEDTPPLPTPPTQFSQSLPKSATPPGNSILDRKRPVVSGYEHLPRHRVPSEPIKLNMDSPYYMSSGLTSSSRSTNPRPVPNGNHSSLSVVSVGSLDKNLPLAPPEESARDRVAQLNAKLQSLANRRININQAIKQMTELMPTDRILASDEVIRKREKEKRKVEVLRDELANVQREEYDLGLKLHRAYKRLDRDADFEPTTLWVRRVTG
ncbi:uncharacterized protein BCR38DRAFT_410768 [Pseudomassariella vexata]|uniref:Uncharacterized protein n=1 Tax=Pseudomassariella vexata TaxID=1141098 RepID=A0A1Y2DSU5_9PEZI|nr:uncharacterized protein BCR38DRAFT_410768 [Pseudomassariella vexata]ORY62341.1 hypothetical protein BCR38DRAFT_410768 [Pseudomassariella vexata]